MLLWSGNEIQLLTVNCFPSLALLPSPPGGGGNTVHPCHVGHQTHLSLRQTQEEPEEGSL